MLHLISGGGDTRLVWYYAGNRDEITGFNVYVNGSSIGYIGPDRYSLSVAAHGPPCGETYHYQLTAYHLDSGGVTGESPPSNEAHWTAAACPHRVRVSFETIRTGGDWGHAEEYADDSKTGPIYGSFFANEQQLDFDMADTRWALFVPYPDGEYLSTNSVYDVDELFTMPDIPDLIGCGVSDCPPYSAPAVDHLIVNLGPYDDLAFGGWIMDYDVMSDNDERFSDRLVLPAEMIDPGLDHEYTMTDGNITLTVRVEVLED